METDNRNIVDFYRYWKTDAIIADLETKRNNFSVLCSNVIGDFNLGSIIRSCNAFLANDVIIYGKRSYDRRSTVGTHLYEKLSHVKNIEGLAELRAKYANSYIIGVDNIKESKDIETYHWPIDKHIILCFGEERIGLTDEVKSICDDFIYIKQQGSVRSLNVGVAAGIAIYSLSSKIQNSKLNYSFSE